MEIVLWLLRVIGVYLVIGAAFSLWFVVDGVGRISPQARGSGWGFRVLIAPGSAALWPVLLFEMVASRGRGGVIVGRALHAADVETALDDVSTDDGDSDVIFGGSGDAVVHGARFVDPEAETDAGPDVSGGRGSGGVR